MSRRGGATVLTAAFMILDGTKLKVAGIPPGVFLSSPAVWLAEWIAPRLLPGPGPRSYNQWTSMIEGQATDAVISSAQAEYDTLRYVSPERSCPYLPDKKARSEAYWVERLDIVTYERLLTRGFRRSGRVIYRPRCRACCECRQIRIPVNLFKPTRSLRRVARRNADVQVDAGRPTPSEEKFALYCRYLDTQHDGSMARSYDTFCEFLYDSPMETTEFHYRVGERLIGVSIADRVPSGLSSVYMYFDPDFADRSVGTFSVLWEIDDCRRAGLHYYYLGFYVAGSPTMSYKARFRPNEILVADDRWVTLQV